MNIGERIKARREQLNMSQSELARKVGYTSRSTINKIEKDGRGISQDKIVAIATALKTTPSYLMGWDEDVYIDEEGNATIVADLTSDEELIFEKVRKMRPDYQRMLLGMIDTLLEMQDNLQKG